MKNYETDAYKHDENSEITLEQKIREDYGENVTKHQIRFWEIPKVAGIYELRVKTNDPNALDGYAYYIGKSINLRRRLYVHSYTFNRIEEKRATEKDIKVCPKLYAFFQAQDNKDKDVELVGWWQQEGNLIHAEIRRIEDLKKSGHLILNCDNSHYIDTWRKNKNGGNEMKTLIQHVEEKDELNLSTGEEFCKLQKNIVSNEIDEDINADWRNNKFE